MRKAIIPLVATAAAQLLVIGSIAAAFAFQPKETQLPIAMIPVQADIEQGECIRRDPAPYEPITYHVPLDADLQQYTAEMCDLYEVPLPEWCVSVKKAMVERDDMSVTELAKEIGYSRAHVSQVINGTMVPSANIKSAIESCLNLRA